MSHAIPYHELSARQRLASLVDEGSFDELLAPPERETSPYLEALGQPIALDDGLIAGRAKLSGREIFIAAQEGGFVGGAVGEVHAAKLTGLLQAAAREKLPVVLLVESGGVRLHEGSAGEIGIAESMRAVFECRAAGVATVAVIGSDIGAYGGMGILSACCEHVVMTEHGRLGVSGPIVIQKWMGVEEYDASDRALVWMTSGGKTKYLLGDAERLSDDDISGLRAAVESVLGESKQLDLSAVKARHAALSERLEKFGETKGADEVWGALGVSDIDAANFATADEFLELLKGRP